MVRMEQTEMVRNSSGSHEHKPQPPVPPQLRYYLSPVDYEAWRKGYMPPTEHVLIDALAHRDAKVVSMSSFAKGNAWWFVVQGKRPSVKMLNAMWRLLYAEEEKELAADGDNGMPESPSP